MIDLTLIWRLSDQLPLSGHDKDPKSHAHHIKQRASIIENLSLHSSHQHFNAQLSSREVQSNLGVERRAIALQNSGSGSSRAAGNLCFHVLLDQGIGIITLSDIGNELSQQFLDELKKEFLMQHSNDLDQVEQPYAFAAFEHFIENTSRSYENTRTQHNLGRLKSELSDVQSIVKQNIEEVIGREDKLRDMSKKSHVLRNSAHRFKRGAVYANQMYLWKTYGPAIVTIVIVLVVFLLYRYVFRF